MRYLSVCSGIEAASVAWEPLGWTAAGFAEIEPFPRAVLEQRHGAVAVDFNHRWTAGQNYAPMFGDFTKIGTENVGPIDILVGGTPCQSFSIAGKRLGLDDPRGNLAIEFLALAKRVRADWLVWENVPGVYSSWSGEPENEATSEWEETADFAEFLNLFRECGYRGGWRTIDAQYVRVDGFGRAVPQRRRRVFLVGHSGNDTRAASVLFDAASLQGIAKPRRTSGEGFAGSSGRNPEGDRKPVAAGISADNAPLSDIIAGTVSSKWAKGSGGPSGDECQNLVAVPYRRLAAAEYVEDECSSACRARDAKDFGDLVAVPVAKASVEVAGAICKDSFSGGISGRPDGAAVGHILPARIQIPFSGDCTPTLTSNGDQHSGFRHGAGHVAVSEAFAAEGVASFDGWAIRKLTPRECERLQGFPDDFTDIEWRGKSAPDGARYKALGNSMAVNVMRWIGRRIETIEQAVKAAEKGKS